MTRTVGCLRTRTLAITRIERELEELQNTVIDTMGTLTDHDDFDPLHLHSLVHSVSKDLGLIGDSLNGIYNADGDFDATEAGMEDYYYAETEIVIQKANKSKKKGQSKGSRKGSKHLQTQSTTDG